MKNYSQEEEEFLRDNFSDYTNKELADKLNRTVDGIANKLKELGLIRRPIKPYSREEIAFIEANIGNMTVSEIASQLGRTQGGISKYVSKFRISKIRKRKKVYLENIDKDVVPFFSKGDSYREILEKMKPGDSVEFPEADKAVVSNQKYMLINELKHRERNLPLFTIRKTEVKEGNQMYRIWRLS